MNLPNKLTMIRLWITIVLIIFLSMELSFSYTIALFIFVFASITDYYDGKIARARKIITTFGRFWDPLADKILICSVFVFFASLKGIPVKPWMSIVIISREFLVTGLRLIAAKDNVIISADPSGKIKTVFQVFTIIMILSALSLNEVSASATWLGRVFRLEECAVITSSILTWSTVLLTLLSGAIILWRNRMYLFDQR